MEWSPQKYAVPLWRAFSISQSLLQAATPSRLTQITGEASRCISATACLSEKVQMLLLTFTNSDFIKITGDHVLREVLQYLFWSMQAQLKYICEEPLDFLQNNLPDVLLNSEFHDLKWQKTSPTDDMWSLPDLFADEEDTLTDMLRLWLAEVPLTIDDTDVGVTFGDALSAAQESHMRARNQLKWWHDKAVRLWPGMKSLDDMSACGTMPTQSIHEMLVQLFFPLRFFNATPSQITQVMRGWSHQGAEIENALKVNFYEIDKRRTSDLCNQISMNQVGTPKCIFACVQAETKEWVFAATAPKTPQKVNKFAHADAVWEYMLDQGFGQIFIHMLKDAKYNLKAAENHIVYTNGYAPTPGPPRLVGAGLGGNSTGHLPSVPIDKLAEFCGRLTMTQLIPTDMYRGRTSKGLHLIDKFPMASCCRCNGLTRYQEIPSFMTKDFISQESKTCNYARNATSPHQCAESAAFVMCVRIQERLAEARAAKAALEAWLQGFRDLDWHTSRSLRSAECLQEGRRETGYNLDATIATTGRKDSRLDATGSRMVFKQAETEFCRAIEMTVRR